MPAPAGSSISVCVTSTDRLRRCRSPRSAAAVLFSCSSLTIGADLPSLTVSPAPCRRPSCAGLLDTSQSKCNQGHEGWLFLCRAPIFHIKKISLVILFCFQRGNLLSSKSNQPAEKAATAQEECNLPRRRNALPSGVRLLSECRPKPDSARQKVPECPRSHAAPP